MRKDTIDTNYLKANSTSYQFLFGALAEIVDNARDAGATNLSIFTEDVQLRDDDHTIVSLNFLDDGCGILPEEASNAMKLGYINKFDHENQIGLFGNGLRSASMRIGKDMIIFSKKDSKGTIIFLSTTFHEREQVSDIEIPMPKFDLKTRSPLRYHKNELKTSSILKQYEIDLVYKYSPFRNINELMAQFDLIEGESGTLVTIYNLKDGELDFTTDKTDILMQNFQVTYKSHAQLAHKSFREYTSILYLNPQMKIYIQGKRVVTKRLDRCLYRPVNYKFSTDKLRMSVENRQTESLTFTFGVNLENRSAEGLFLYNCHRLIAMYIETEERQKDIDYRGIVGIVDIPYRIFKPISNKQGFQDDIGINSLIQVMGAHLECYGRSIVELTSEFWTTYGYTHDSEIGPPTSSIGQKSKCLYVKPVVQCYKCLKWRTLPKMQKSIDPSEDWSCANIFEKELNKPSESCQTPEILDQIEFKEFAIRANSVRDIELQEALEYEQQWQREKAEREKKLSEFYKKNAHKENKSTADLLFATKRRVVALKRKAPEIGEASVKKESVQVPKNRNNLLRSYSDIQGSPNKRICYQSRLAARTMSEEALTEVKRLSQLNIRLKEFEDLEADLKIISEYKEFEQFKNRYADIARKVWDFLKVKKNMNPNNHVDSSLADIFQTYANGRPNKRMS